MKTEIGKKYLITTDDWFYAPDGNNYKSVFGTLTGVYSDDETLGVKTNRGSTNWYIQVGLMTIAGCQIHYAIQCDNVSSEPPVLESWAEKGVQTCKAPISRIYMADTI